MAIIHSQCFYTCSTSIKSCCQKLPSTQQVETATAIANGNKTKKLEQEQASTAATATAAAKTGEKKNIEVKKQE